MRSFLLKGKSPIISWGNLPPNTYYEGLVPEGFALAVNPSENYIVIDIDRHGDIDGLKNVPIEIYNELFKIHFHYKTKNNGFHVWCKYSGNKVLANKTSGLGIDLRVGHKAKNNGGYVVWYPKEDVRDCLHLIKDTSENLNYWLESLFSYK